jgi:hypothetical protein
LTTDPGQSIAAGMVRPVEGPNGVMKNLKGDLGGSTGD